MFSIELKSSRDHRSFGNGEAVRFEQRSEAFRRRPSRPGERRAHHVDELRDDDRRDDEAKCAIGNAAEDLERRVVKGVVRPGQVGHEEVRVGVGQLWPRAWPSPGRRCYRDLRDPGRLPADRAIAASVIPRSSNASSPSAVAGMAAAASDARPAKSSTLRLGRTSMSSSPSRGTNSISSPGRAPRASRTAFGTVICPWLVRRARRRVNPRESVTMVGTLLSDAVMHNRPRRRPNRSGWRRSAAKGDAGYRDAICARDRMEAVWLAGSAGREALVRDAVRAPCSIA